MPRAHPELTPQARSQLRTALEVERRSHSATIANGPPEPDSEPHLSGSYNSSQRLLGDIETALSKLDRDEYGFCDDCESVIPLPRLEVLPHTRHCVNCASASPGTARRPATARGSAVR